jgi:hypothetical protein
MAQLSNVPKRTIINWLDGTVKRPRHWQSVVRVAAALRLSQTQTDELLIAAELPDLASLVAQTNDPEDHSLLDSWQLEPLAAEKPKFDCLYQYLHALCHELERLPAYFPRHTAFTFASLYQDMRLRRLESAPPIDVNHYVQMNDGTPWSLLRQQNPRAVILGQPGMGKTWLFKA